MAVYSEDQWLSWMDELAEKDFVTVDDFISDEMYSTIMNFFSSAEEEDKLKKAGIGTRQNYQVQDSVRGDFIYWLDSSRDVKLTAFFELMNELMQSLRRYCYLSLSGSEFHIAKYPPGSRYKRHLDQFHERSNRQITVLVYLNEDWEKGDGGELKIYKGEEEIIIEPIAKRLLLFKSDMIEHEVLTTNIPRYSLTGWLLHKPAGAGYLYN